LATSQEVIDLIIEAFASVSRPPPERFSHCDQCDLWLERFIESDVHDWSALSGEDISHEYAALTAVTPEGWRFLLPAYMIWYIRHPDAYSNTSEHLLWQLTRRSEDDLQKRACFEGLNFSQARAVEAFLSFVVVNAEEEHKERDARAALESYWQQADA
jgi:hypothetical protein